MSVAVNEQDSTFSSAVASRTDLIKPESQWTWQELRDYVCSQIEQKFGAFPRDSAKESGIFKRYMNDYGTEGVFVAKAAFEVYGGWWKGAPIRVTRFTKGSDPYFTEPILALLKGE